MYKVETGESTYVIDKTIHVLVHMGIQLERASKVNRSEGIPSGGHAKQRKPSAITIELVFTTQNEAKALIKPNLLCFETQLRRRELSIERK